MYVNVCMFMYVYIPHIKGDYPIYLSIYVCMLGIYIYIYIYITIIILYI